MYLSEQALIKRLLNTTAGGTSTLTSTFARAGYDRCLILALLGDVADTSVLTLTGKTGDASNGSDAVAITGGSTTFTADATSADNGMLAIDLTLNDDDYITWTLARATANAAVDGVIALLYHSRFGPVSQANLLATIGRACAL